MSTELETEKTIETPPTAGRAPSPEAIPANRSSAKTLHPWQRRRYQLTAGAVIALLVAAFVGNNVIARQYTPDGAVRQYLAALQTGDESNAWANLQVVGSQQSATVSLTDESALRSALAASRPDIRSFDVTGVAYRDDADAVVSVAIQTSKGTQQARLAVQRSGERRYGLYPIWRVSVAPIVLSLALPAGVGGVSIDGQALDLQAGKSLVAVLPVVHKVTFKGTSLLTEQTVTVDGFAKGDQAIPFQPVFTTPGLDKVKSAVSAFFADVCTKQTSALSSATCPQVTTRYLPYAGSWQVVGDPTRNIVTAMDPSQRIFAGGRFQMVFAYAETGVAGVRHVPDGSSYSALLLLSNSDIKVDHIARNDAATSAPRPAGATDQAAEALVVTAFQRCASIAAETVADCPQAAPDIAISNVRWSMQGDPTAGATVTYDGSSGLIVVHGNFSMGVSYTWFGQSHSASSYITHFDAYLFWDGNQLQLVTIDGAES